MYQQPLSRRHFITIAAIGTTGALAGCVGDDDAPADDPDNDFVDDEPDYDGWFDDVDNYDGTYDWTGEDAVTIQVGTGPDGYQYEPAAVAIDPGTTVTWEWTGDGGSHDVVHEGGEFASEMKVDEGETFDHQFDDPGTYRYYCTPHRDLGMKGAVYVQD